MSLGGGGGGGGGEREIKGLGGDIPGLPPCMKHWLGLREFHSCSATHSIGIRVLPTSNLLE